MRSHCEGKVRVYVGFIKCQKINNHYSYSTPVSLAGDVLAIISFVMKRKSHMCKLILKFECMVVICFLFRKSDFIDRTVLCEENQGIYSILS